MTWMLIRLVLSLVFVGLVLWFAARHGQLLQKLIAHVATVRRSIRLQLSLVGPPEFDRRDVPPFDSSDRVS